MNRRSLSATIALTIGILLAASLSVYATSLGTNLSVTGGLTVGTNQLVVQQNSGKVGIGTTSPTSLLTISAFGGTTIELESTHTDIASRNWAIMTDTNTFGDFAIKTSTAKGGNPRTGTTRLQIDSSGNVGIGTTSPFALLSVNAPAGSASFAIGSSTATSFITDAAGNIGIGTPAPTGSLHITRDSSYASMIVSQASNSGLNPYIELRMMRGTHAVPADVQNGDTAGGYSATVRSGASFLTIGQLTMEVDGTFTSGARPPGRLTFLTSNNSGSIVERMRLTNTGSLGIATTSPWRTLSVTGTLALSSTLTTATTGNYLCINTANYEITSGTTCSASSERFKDNIKPIPYGLESILKLSPVSFTYKKEYNPDPSTKLGLIAEQVDQFIPELVAKDKDNKPESVDYAKLTPVLIRAVQEQDAKISALLINQNTDAIIQNGITVKRISSSLGQWSIDEQGTINATRVVAKEVVVVGKTLTVKAATHLDGMVTVGTAERPEGVTMFDSHGHVGCLMIQDVDAGLMKITRGECSSTSSPQPVPQPLPPPPAPAPILPPASIPPPQEAPASSESYSTSTPEAGSESSTTETKAATSSAEQPSPLFDISSQPTSKPLVTTAGIVALAALVVTVLGGVVFLKRRG